MSFASGIQLLYRLASLYGVQPAYYDVSRRRRQASVEALLAVLRSLGAPLVSVKDVPAAWRERRQEGWQRLLEPVTVAWNGEPPKILVRLPSGMAGSRFSCFLRLDNGEWHHWHYQAASLPVQDTAEIEGASYVTKLLTLPASLPWGYHRISLEIAGKCEEALIISAPLRAYAPPEKERERVWGVFLPLYALQTEKSWGSGQFPDMEVLVSWLAEMGGGVVATLPLLATFLNENSDPSPYLPISRLLWSEFYLDVNRVPEMRRCPQAQALCASLPFQQEIKALCALSLVDYHRVMALKRQVLQELCRCFFAEDSSLEGLHNFIEVNPVIEEYARFRAAGDRQRVPWRSWPQPLRDGALKNGDYDEESWRYHMYVQWLAHQQMTGLSEQARKKGIKLYLDLPLGVHPDGYDVWRERDTFISGVTAGAPPDVVFTRGQNWWFPPLHPEKIRRQGYRYTIAYLRHHLQHAGILRVDHVMGMHRLFCIPEGVEASKGVYLRYRPEEQYAILALESHRHRTMIVGEDLGMVPPYVRPSMKRHGFYRMFILHYELAANLRKGPPPIPSNSVTSLNTHDMPPFASFWQELDIEERRELGLLDRASARKESSAYRKIKKGLLAFLQKEGWLGNAGEDLHSILRACLSFLAASRSAVVLVNLEDLWLETHLQNMPGTREEYPSWRRKARHSLEEFCQMPQVVATLRAVDRIRKQGRCR